MMFRNRQPKSISDAGYEEDLVRRMIDEGRDPYSDPEFLGYVAVRNARPVGNDVSGNPKYSLVEMPEYLKGRERMADRGADLADLDSVVLILRYGYLPPKGSHPHRLHGKNEGLLECHIGGRRSNRVLVYRYDGTDLILHNLD